MIQLINTSNSTKKVFINGFWKGMAAPVMLFGSFAAPERTEVKPLQLVFKTDLEALSSDWNAIGLDLKKVIENNGKKANSSSKQ